MRLGGVTVQVPPNGNLGNLGRSFGELGGMPTGAMAPPRQIPPLAMPRPPPKHYSSPSLSLGPPTGLDGQREVSQTADNEQQQKNKEEEYESRSGSDNMEGGSGDEDPDNNHPRKKRYHRHTPRQIQEMEMLFKECPHPDDKQRQQLSKDLGLEPRQVKFWFQNRRTQMKAQTERAENSMLRAENEKVRSENLIMREALKNPQCPHCGGPATVGEMTFDEQQLRIENVRLKEELDRVSALAAKYLGRPITPMAPLALPSSSLDLQVGGGSSFGGMHPTPGNLDLVAGPSVADVATRPGGLTEAEKPMVVELAMMAMEELVRMAQAEEPLWLSMDSGKAQLNYDEYMRQFPRGIGMRPSGLKPEATRETALVMMNGVNLVETLMDATQWMDMFPCMVSRALTVDVLSTGVTGNRNGALQLMYAELQVLSPLVPTREIYFLRYCKQHAEGVWAVVDVSVDSLRDNPPPSLMRCRRRPSGVLIQDTPNGYAKVTCVEHMEYDDRAVHRMYRELVNTGMAFGAQRWLATLQRQCERLASLLASNIASRDLGGVPSASGRRSMLKLAQRMTNNFCAGVSASTVHTWTTLSGSGDDDVRVMTRKSVDNPGEPHGIVLSAATSMWLPVSPARVFQFLRDERLRSEWDILSNGGIVTEMAHIAKGQDPGNSVSLLRVNAMNSNQSNMLILQESCTDVSGSLVIYAPVDIPAMNLVLQGGDPAYVALLPSGFAILPDGPGGERGSLGVDQGSQLTESSRGTGSLLTVAFQILVSSIPSARLSLESVATVNNLISCTVQRIKSALLVEDA
ncbi:homeobox-leucine zipper protein PROTODERMAL FACTOR 2 isoform X1 [Physcomitrium patens]|uniref:Class IV HD-Zip protein HDZ43 n=1 Tax=Physcomitrium patens TaxID=3218 RepID=Q147S4_PHYPA|nr:homeobox-leucine zipper protein HDG2-like isoform X1 [Physcomitrium patens]XP_024394839.1 homeobox-leucine zipper protein HDG2-like isoform X1 [Physcomitrium patens]DAA05777.1 TPA_inf: class IV HD-Zip protein HDZ43 [Physcomitrium patens]|eukprot:XP_024394838.1 homeobox-leucine zipper protein HDG2-like isoform X1 [Physcomitrella patens]